MQHRSGDQTQNGGEDESDEQFASERAGGGGVSSYSSGWVEIGVRKNLMIFRIRMNDRINVRIGNPVVISGDVWLVHCRAREGAFCHVRKPIQMLSPRMERLEMVLSRPRISM